MCGGGGVCGRGWGRKHSEICFIHRLGLFLGLRTLNFAIFWRFREKVAILLGTGHLAGIFGGHFQK